MHDVNDEVHNSARELAAVIASHGEWLYTEPRRDQTIPLRRGEIEVRAERHRIWLTCFGEYGVQIWRVVNWDWTEVKLLIQAEQRAGGVRVNLLFLPRATAAAALEVIAAERRERSRKMAELVAAEMPGFVVERASLSPGVGSGQPGRYARIVLNEKGRRRIAVTGSVADGGNASPDVLLSGAMLWFNRLKDLVGKPAFTGLRFVGLKPMCDVLERRICLLRESLRREIELFELAEDWTSAKRRTAFNAGSLWTTKPPLIRRPPEPIVSETAAAIAAQAPDAIDVTRGGRGETVRFHGLAFARIRQLLGKEHVWFGIDRAKRRVVTDRSLPEFGSYLDELREHRSADTSDRNHAMYRGAPENWLESMLRRDVTQLDPGLRLAPIYAQFRAPFDPPSVPRPVDLLALRQDGRLAVIELKVAADREHVFQGLDYWTRIELHRRWGTIQRARLFDDAMIADEPPLVYLVAPMLSFHRNFSALAQSVSPEIEIYRFDLNEDWRAGIKVTRRVRCN
ncbi:MAG: hypothetical protein ABIP75_12295 [Pyrinomonadaceae bacterium]